MVDRVTQNNSRIPVAVKHSNNHMPAETTITSRVENDKLSKHSLQDNGIVDTISDAQLASGDDSSKKEKGFETFLMTGDMIIRTTPSQKTRSPDSKGSNSDSDVVIENGNDGVYTTAVFLEDKNIPEFAEKMPSRSEQQSAESGFEDGNITDKDREKSSSNITEPSSVSDLSLVSSEDLTELNISGSRSESVSTTPTCVSIDDSNGTPMESSDNKNTSSTSDPEINHESCESGASALDSSRLQTSKSAEKFVIYKGEQQYVVRTSKSQELQSGNEFSLVSIDIDEDNKAYSLDQIPQPGGAASTVSLDNLREDAPGSRSLDSSPDHKADIKNIDKEFIPGFINLGDSGVKKSKVKDRLDENGAMISDSSSSQNNNGLGDRNIIDGVDYTSSSPRDSLDPTLDPNFMDYQPQAKGVDRPSAHRLAKRLYMLDGFKKSDVSRHLSKKNEFGSLVSEEYLKFFDFAGLSLDGALRQFLKQFSLIGETQERERVLAHFSKHYVDSNLDGVYNSEDACHTLTCAIMLLNTDLNGQAVGRKMTCAEFVENLSDLNDGENFPKEVLKNLYLAIKAEQIEWAVDEDMTTDNNSPGDKHPNPTPAGPVLGLGYNPFIDIPDPDKTTEYKSGYVMRKCCMDAYKRRTAMGKRSWRMCYAALRDMVLFLYKDQHGMKKKQLIEGSHNVIRVHHSLASKALDYSKKQHVLRLQTAVGSEYLFQTSDSRELQEWIDTINFVAASLSAPQLPGAVGSTRKFQRPLLPATYTRHNMQQQMLKHEEMCSQIESDLLEHRKYPPEKGSKARIIQEYMEKEAFLDSEITRYKTYVYLLQSRMASYQELEPSLVETTIGEDDESTAGQDSPKSPTRRGVHRSLSDRTSDRSLDDYRTSHSNGVLVYDEHVNSETVITHF